MHTTDELIAAMKAKKPVKDLKSGKTGYIVGWWMNNTCFFSVEKGSTGVTRNPQDLEILTEE